MNILFMLKTSVVKIKTPQIIIILLFVKSFRLFTKYINTNIFKIILIYSKTEKNIDLLMMSTKKPLPNLEVALI